ncbi:M23 family metallopeptidase [Cellulosilyticum ruminicola]|uniref:M23 family metallopeptidase n=1 Tax=Cellulosilyticum ruminicola TaxID=425254 RepID=UPI0006D172C9|nr:M23 family metallopeptidase [Cellulosilyticum ruminicola]
MAFLEHMKSNKKKYSLVAAAMVAGVTISWFSLRHNAYAISINGAVIAVVKEKETVAPIYTSVVEHIKEEVGTDIAVHETLAVEPIHSSSKKINSEEDVRKALNEAVSYDVAAYEIMVDGKGFVAVESREIALQVLEKIAKSYLPNDGSVILQSDATEETVQNEEVASEGQEENAEPEKMQEDSSKAEAAQDKVIQESIETVNETSTAAIDKKESETTDSAVKDNGLSEAQADADKGNVALDPSKEVIEIPEALPEKEVNESVSVGKLEVEKIIENKDSKSKGQKIEREIKDLDFHENVTIRNVYVDKDDILTADEAENVLLGNTQETLEYELQEGDNIWDLAMQYGTTMEHILEINPQIEDETKMQIGDVIKLEVPNPILSITTVTETNYKELIPAKIQYVEFSDLYKDETKVYREGNDGIKEVTVDVTKVNGKEVSRKMISEKTLKEAKIKVIAYGTKEKPKVSTNNGGGSASASVSSSSEFMHPLNGSGSISSTYGSRWGTFHYGLDFAAPAGTPIYASASGRVIYSGYNQGGYGKLIIIDHGNGYQTYYAHCSSLYVNVGESVSQGQNIAGVGTTGDSTGNHLHFEVRIGGTPVNPYGYVF